MTCLEGVHISWFGESECMQVVAAGGKGASLSNMARMGLPVPPGFVVCTETFRQFLKHAELDKEIAGLLANVDVEDQLALDYIAAVITQKIEAQEPATQLRDVISQAYQRLCDQAGGLAVVAVRSSAAAEDSKGASFAGQQETYLNIYGAECVLNQVRACWCSFFKPRAIFYRKLKGSLLDQNIAVVVQRMVNPDKSGVMFTVDPVQRRRDRVMIEAAWGLGEAVVSGMVTPDNYIVDKDDGSLVSQFIADKKSMVVREESGVGVRWIELPPEKAKSQVLSLDEISALANLGTKIEEHFGAPQDVEWAIEGQNLFVLQSRPVTTL